SATLPSAHEHRLGDAGHMSRCPASYAPARRSYEIRGVHQSFRADVTPRPAARFPNRRRIRMVTKDDDQKKSLTIGEQLKRAGVPRRDFLKFCTQLMIAAPVGLALTKKSWAGEVAQEIARLQR